MHPKPTLISILKLLALGVLVFVLAFFLPARTSLVNQTGSHQFDHFELLHFSLGMRNEDFNSFFKDRPESLYTYRDAETAINRLPRKYDAEMRIRGTHAWNWDWRKPSFRLRLKEMRQLVGQNMLDFINPDDASMLANLLADNIANQIGLPSPRTRLCTVTLNLDYKGLYHLAEPINRHTLELQGFNQCSIIEGNIRNSKIWHDKQVWTIEARDDRLENQAGLMLEKLLETVRTPVDLKKIVELQTIIDVKKYALWSALMTAIASIHTNDFIGNVLVFDHQNSRMFPAIADSTGFGVITSMAAKHEEIDVKVPINEFLTPILNAYLRIPEYHYLRNLALYQLLSQQLEPQQLKNLRDQYLSLLRPLFAKEPYAAALVNVPLVLFSRKIPVSAKTQLEDADRLIDFMKARRNFLLELLDNCEVVLLTTDEHSTFNNKICNNMIIAVRGHSPVEMPADSSGAGIFADIDFDGRLDIRIDDQKPVLFYPALKEAGGEYPHWLMVSRRFANFVLEPDWQFYRIGIESEHCKTWIDHFANQACNAITRKKVEIQIKKFEDSGFGTIAPSADVIHTWSPIKNGQIQTIF
ncbi:MAG: CotH kinase family protein [Candidatus Riflebacteria bacterium]